MSTQIDGTIKRFAPASQRQRSSRDCMPSSSMASSPGDPCGERYLEGTVTGNFERPRCSSRRR
jgi:hypothetical protein